MDETLRLAARMLRADPQLFPEFLAHLGLKRWDCLRTRAPGESGYDRIQIWALSRDEAIEKVVGDAVPNDRAWLIPAEGMDLMLLDIEIIEGRFNFRKKPDHSVANCDKCRAGVEH